MKTIVKAALGFNNLSPEGKVIKAQSMKDGMQASGNFPASTMPITYPSIQTIITNLHTAAVAANNGTTTDTSFMHEQERILVSAFNFIKAHVEFVANNTTDAATVIVAAGMQVAAIGGANGVSELTLDAIGNGTLQVRVPRQTDQKAFVFEYSADGATWVDLTSSSLTKVTLANQTPGSNIYVRYYGISKTGKGAYSQTKSAIVL
jgi:hypothetical protein